MIDPRTSTGRPDRRRFLRAAGAGLSAALLPLAPLGRAASQEGRRKSPWDEEPRGPYAPFRMALQSYSLKKLDFQETIDAAYDLGLGLIEFWPGHLPADIDDGELHRRLRAMRHNLIRRIAYGVVEFTGDHEKNREIFEFAEKLGVHALTASPAPESFDSLDRLVEDFGIAVAIHNHGPEDKRYGKPDLIEKAIRDRRRLIGLCADTGHFLRSGVDPVEAVKAFEGRIHAVHLKDMKSEGGELKPAILGKGDLDLVRFLRALKDAGFRGGLALEYEEEPENPLPSIEKCLKAVQEAVKKL